MYYRNLAAAAIAIVFCISFGGCSRDINKNQDSYQEDSKVMGQKNDTEVKSDESYPDGKNDLVEQPEIVKDSVQPSPKPEEKSDAKKTVKPEEKAVAGSVYNNKKYAWSFVRKKDHLPPAFETKQAQLADKYKAIYIGDTSKKVVYLTFDEGYENGYTPKILDTLKVNNVKAAFFITMPYLKKEFKLVDRMVKEGHTVGNHTVHHPSMPDVVDDEKLENEMLDLDRNFYEVTGKSMKYLRPPMGEYSERTLKISKDLGYRNVFWSFAYADWNVNSQKGTQYAYKMIMDNVHNGAVLLLHAVSRDNAEVLGSVIKDLKSQGYTFGTLDEIKE